MIGVWFLLYSDLGSPFMHGQVISPAWCSILLICFELTPHLLEWAGVKLVDDFIMMGSLVGIVINKELIFLPNFSDLSLEF